MSDLRLESVPFTFEGRSYALRCNMNVLADVQEAYGGDLTPALTGRGTLRSVLEFLAAMMNDYADEQGWFDPDPLTGEAVLPKRFTMRSLGRRLRREDIPMVKILGLVTAAIAPKKKDESEPDPQDPGN